ncbi:MAG: ABC transporter ATP-binding protein [Oscillospiraceae bacterium]|nr:ABC transporter ATP-binding protein [Oscillospiraceae bacterium]
MSILKRFVSYYRPYMAFFLMDIFCAVVLSVIDLSFPQILRWLPEGLFSGSAESILSALKWLFPALLGMYLVRALCQFFVTSFGHIMGTRMETDMRQDLFNQYMRMSFSYYDKNNTGEMMSRLVTDLFDISELAHHGPENLLLCSLKIIGSFVLLLRINVPMTLILLAVTGVLVVFTVLRQTKMQSIFTENRQRIAEVNAGVQNSLAGIRVVKTFACEAGEEENFHTSNGRYRKSKERSYMAMGIFHGGSNFIQGMLYVAIIVSGGFFIAHGSLSYTDLAIYALYIGIFITPIGQLMDFTEMLQKGYAGFKRFHEIMETQPEIQEKPNALPLTNVKGDLEFRDVTFSYNEKEQVLSHLNISIPAGETCALVGPSGGGKTTICSLLPRFYEVDSGSVLVDGHDVRELELKSLREAIGIVQQDVYIFAGSIRENIAYGKKDATQEEIETAAKNANIHDFILSLDEGYDTYVGERGTRLSGGQKQRIAIARVFLKNPPILILDEATSALDNESEKHIQEALDRLSVGRTTVVIAHRLSTIRGAEKIIVIDEGGVQEQGSHQELMEKGGTYARYFNMQFEGLDIQLDR